LGRLVRRWQAGREGERRGATCVGGRRAGRGERRGVREGRALGWPARQEVGGKQCSLSTFKMLTTGPSSSAGPKVGRPVHG
jgi:hypothetical protein